MYGTLRGALAAREIRVDPARYTATVEGRIEGTGRTIRITEIAIHYDLLIPTGKRTDADRALLYRQHRGLDLAAITPAVVVQRMLTSDVAGVMFTRDPETAGDACVISSAHGLCEGVTSDVVETDTYRCNSAGEIEKRIAEKNARVVSSRRGGIDTVPVPENLRHAPVLSDQQITELYEVGRRLEEIFGAPQDVEWSFDAGVRY